jgi:hypothetical protein
VNVVTGHGHTALDLAMLHNHPAVVQVLADAGGRFGHVRSPSHVTAECLVALLHAPSFAVPPGVAMNALVTTSHRWALYQLRLLATKDHALTVPQLPAHALHAILQEPEYWWSPTSTDRRGLSVHACALKQLRDLAAIDPNIVLPSSTKLAAAPAAMVATVPARRPELNVGERVRPGDVRCAVAHVPFFFFFMSRISGLGLTVRRAVAAEWHSAHRR